MTSSQTEEIIENLKGKGIQFSHGLTGNEVIEIQKKFDFIFPQDLKSFLQTELPISEKFYNWREALSVEKTAERIFWQLQWPLEGLLFDIERNEFWLDPWGKQPKHLEDQYRIATNHYEKWPKLIPVYSHRYIPCITSDSGNPIFSVQQTDIIYYGFDLADYFSKEFNFPLSDKFEKLDKPKNYIEFWSWFVENC